MSGESPLRYGSDVIVDLLAQAGIEYVAFNPGASFRALHDSLVHAPPSPAGNLRRPAIVTCLHETVSVALAQGYAKAAGRPMAVALHDVVGLQNASMAIYNAWCDRAPILLLGGTGPLAKGRRRPWIDWIHTASSQAELVRNYVKWDDQPHDLYSVSESFARGLRTAVAEPAGPVYLCYDVDLQEDPVPDGFVAEVLERYPAPSAPAAPPGALDALAELLAGAERPVFVAGHSAESDADVSALVGLAELLGAAVIDTAVRLAFPTAHPLNATALPEVLEGADVVVVLDVDDPRGVLGPVLGDGARPGTARVIHVGLGQLRARGWSHDYQSYPAAERYLTASAGSVVNGLRARLERHAGIHDVAPWRARGAALGERSAAERAARRRVAAASTAEGAVPLERMLVEVGVALGDEAFVLANGTNERLEHRLWSLTRPRQHCGWHAGGGLGYGLGASVGVALAVGDEAITLNIQADGDALFTPGALWTMAHERLPILTVVHNNREYANSVGHAERIARARGRGLDQIGVGTALNDPAIDITGLARAFGVLGIGPVSDPDELVVALDKALAVVRGGAPALVEVVTPSSAPPPNSVGHKAHRTAPSKGER